MLLTCIKERFPKVDPAARLGVLARYARAEPRKVFFWRYRNHIVVDTETELPVWEQTESANRKEGPIALPLLRVLTQALPLRAEAVCADSAYDSEAFLKFIVETLHAKPIVAAHPRHQSNRPYPALRRHLDVARFQAAVDGSVLMRRFERLRHLAGMTVRGGQG